MVDVVNVFKNELTKIDTCEFLPVGKKLIEHLGTLSSTHKDPSLKILHKGIKENSISYSLLTPGLTLNPNYQKTVADLTDEEKKLSIFPQLQGVKTLENLANPIKSLLDDSQRAITSNLPKDLDDKATESLIRLATNCIALAVRLEKSKTSWPYSYFATIIDETFKQQLTYDQFKAKLYAIGAEVLSRHSIDFEEDFKKSLKKIDKQNAFACLAAEHERCRLDQTVSTPTSKTDTATTSVISETPPASPESSIVVPGSNGGTPYPILTPINAETLLAGLTRPPLDDGMAGFEEVYNSLEDFFKEAASAAHKTINKGSFLNFVITVFGFQWGHYAKLTALEKIKNDQTPTLEQLKTALNMHRFMPFITCGRGHTNSFKNNEEKLKELQKSVETVTSSPNP